MHSLTYVIVAGLALGARSDSGSASSPPTQAVAPAVTPLERALAAARVSGKPVLVIVTGPEVRAQRGRWLADLFALRGDVAYAQLALVEVVFATKREFLAALPTDLLDAAQSCEVGLVDVLSGSPEFVCVLDAPGCAAMAGRPDSAGYCEGLSALGANLEQHLAVISKRTSAVRQRLARSGLSAAQLRDLDLALANVHRADSDVAVRAAWCYFGAGDVGAGRSNYRGDGGQLTDLANALSAEWDRQPPYGARFAQFDGSRWSLQATAADDARDLGLLLERAQQMEPRSLSRVVERRACSGPCGSGHSSVVSYAFLDEYTRVLVDATDMD